MYAVSAAVTAQCEGLILREERPLVSQDGYLLVAARDGERLPAGGLIAVEARSAEALAEARGALFDGARDVPEAVMALSEPWTARGGTCARPWTRWRRRCPAAGRRRPGRRRAA